MPGRVSASVAFLRLRRTRFSYSPERIDSSDHGLRRRAAALNRKSCYGCRCFKRSRGVTLKQLPSHSIKSLAVVRDGKQSLMPENNAVQSKRSEGTSMLSFAKRTAKSALESLGWKIGNSNFINTAIEDAEAYHRLRHYVELVSNFDKEELSSALALIRHAKSQIGQDLFAAHASKYKRDGYFVDFGATDGINRNNSHLLETCLGWSGILAEPARVWHRSLIRNRPSSVIETACVWSRSGETISFKETPDGELSTASAFENSDFHSGRRRSGKCYNVPTISLHDLLLKHGAPAHIDYLSIDTEGSEHDILSALDFSLWSFGCITCEHNYSDRREKIQGLLTSHGYKTVLTEHSYFDDWYVQA
ncbi:FkbM family methyltransferase [Bradyrhizobium sp. Arg237L]|uniref:FkbM family methyltransferase n=1 Tax=Bradyrhizobium sp. Arg237L TaxID=3003352 RepID=UPI00249E13B4|nr:FkbM family methyltransferase [Bradyrhizobium sp. Arg237L]MDI4233629.1 FkbM family methyltransferase [Bradyrhizobium sp. Arg237L]